jgi:hypothetical protein
LKYFIALAVALYLLLPVGHGEAGIATSPSDCGDSSSCLVAD